MNKNDLPFYLRKTIQKVFHNLGPGMFGAAYASALCAELKAMGLQFMDCRTCTNDACDERANDLNILVEGTFRIGISDRYWSLEWQPVLK